jgi:2,6-dihydroxypseudooxynicotine hydrolase
MIAGVSDDHDRMASQEDFARFIFRTLDTRMIGDGVPYPDLLALRQEIATWDDWFDAWSRVATAYEREAAKVEERGLSATAGELWFRAAIAWHYAQFLWFHRDEERRHGERMKEAAYRRAAPLLDPPAEGVEIPFEETVIPAYLRLPRGRERAPCTVLIGGLESTKEEGRLFEELCLRRGVATFAFDGPGQGEYFFSRPMVGDFERYSTAVADYLMTRQEIDPERIAILGRSLGGNYAVRSAALDDRFRAVVDWGGPFNLEFFPEMPPLTARGMRYVTGVEDQDEAELAARRMIDLAGLVEHVRVPLYVQHGVLDRVIPVSQATMLLDAAVNAITTVAIDADATHCGHNVFHRVRPAIADWLMVQLSASGRPAR